MRAASQRVPVIGDRVRVQVNDPTETAIGTVHAISRLGIEISDERQRRTFFLAEHIRGLQVSEGEYLQSGRRSLAVVVALGLPGIAAGAAAAAWSPCTATGWFACAFHPGSRARAALWAGLLAAPIGVVWAKSIGKDRLTDSWGQAALPSARPDISIGLFRGAAPRDIGIGVSIPIGAR